jgi:hypothetical protein
MLINLRKLLTDLVFLLILVHDKHEPFCPSLFLNYLYIFAGF